MEKRWTRTENYFIRTVACCSDATLGGQSVELIDEEGRLFGVVNVVDALVVLFVVAVVVAGAALVFGGEPDPEPDPDIQTTHATLDLGTQPRFIVAEINEGDTYSPDGTSQLTITDVHLTPQDGQIRVILRVELQGEARGDSIAYADAPPRLGRSLDITTNLYQVTGQIRAVGQRDTLERESTTVVLRDTVAAEDARDIAPGDEILLAGRTVATIEDTAVYATSNPDRREIFVEAELDAHQQQGERRFGGTPIRRGQTISLPGGGYSIEGRIEQVDGGFAERGSPTTRTVTLRMDGVREDMADAIQPGMSERAGGETIAQVSDVETEPSIIILRGEDGELGVFDHPVDRDVTITAELQVRESTTGVRFKGRSIRQGSTIVLDLGTLTIEATVVSVGG
jgi:hypothetical protein